MHVATEGNVFLIYVPPHHMLGHINMRFLLNLKKYKDVFEKNNDDTLPKHQPYDYTIDLEKGEQPSL